ncbi:hypothetical protein ABPG72_011960 [Tetrahymena utriculariae]
MQGNTTTENKGSEHSETQYFDSFRFHDQEQKDDLEQFDCILVDNLMSEENHQIQNNNNNITQLEQNYAYDEQQSTIQYKGTVNSQTIRQSIIFSYLSKTNLDSRILYFCKMYKVYVIAILFLNKYEKSEEEGKLLYDSCKSFKELHIQLTNFQECKDDQLMDKIQKEVNRQKNNLNNNTLKLEGIEQDRKDYVKSLLKNLNILYQLTKQQCIQNDFKNILSDMKFKDLQTLLFDSKSDEQSSEMELSQIKQKMKVLSKCLLQFTQLLLNSDSTKCQNQLIFNLQ